jgi:flagellar hook-length control protein FliK
VVESDLPATNDTAAAAPAETVASVPPPAVGEGRRVSQDTATAAVVRDTIDAAPLRAAASSSSTMSDGSRGESPLAESPRHAGVDIGASRSAPLPVFAAAVAENIARAPAASAVAAPPPADSEPADVASQLVQSMRVQVRNGVSEAIVHLKPEHLGEVSILLKIEQQSVTATLRAESSDVRELVAQQEPALRQGLAEHGLELRQLTVREDDTRSRQQTPQQRSAPTRRKTAPSTERFEVTV